jgi:hypothetical protein
MSFDSFGYNGVLQLAQLLVNRLLAAQTYERNLVRVAGQLQDGDFVGPIEIPIDQDRKLRMYLLIGKIGAQMSGHNGENRVDLSVPMFGVGLFLDDGTTVTRLMTGDRLLGITVTGVRINKTMGRVRVDFSKVSASSITLAQITVQPGMGGVGGVVRTWVDLDDASVDAILRILQVDVNAEEIRTQIARALIGGALGVTEVNVDPGGLGSALVEWDLFTFDASVDGDTDADDAGALLMLYGPNGEGQGTRTDGSDTIPAAPTAPRFQYTASLRSDVLLADIERMLDLTPFLRQGKRLNTPSYPYGYMVVPATGQRSYSLPFHTDVVTVSAPANGLVSITIGTGGLTPHSRARVELQAMSRREVSFEADDKGAAATAIQAQAGDRLAILVDAISMPGDASFVIWRPAISFVDDGIKLDFQFYKYIDNWCDADGDGTTTVQLFADRSKTFAFGAKVTNLDFDLPGWAYAIGWFGGQLFVGVLGAVILEILIATVVKDFVQGMFDPQASIDAILGELRSALSAPQVPNAALFLDDVIVSPDGMVLSGRGDAGQISSYGRAAGFSTQSSFVLSSPGLYHVVDWTPSITGVTMKFRAPANVVVDSPVETFWNAVYDDMPVLPFRGDSFTLDAGASVLFFVDGPDTFTKVLVERPPPGEAPSTGIIFTWVAYRKRVAQGLQLRNRIKPRVVSETESMVLSLTCYAYEGTIGVETIKFFLSPDTQATGLERWYWDDVEVTDAGLTLPGGTTRVLPGSRELYVNLDQSQLPDANDQPLLHWVRFEATDVFGREQKAKLLVHTPPCVLKPKGIATFDPRAVFRDPRLPLWDPVPFRPDVLVSLLRDRLAAVVAVEPMAGPLVETVTTALTGGLAQLDATSAAMVMQLLLDRFDRPGRG